MHWPKLRLRAAWRRWRIQSAQFEIRGSGADLDEGLTKCIGEGVQDDSPVLIRCRLDIAKSVLEAIHHHQPQQGRAIVDVVVQRLSSNAEMIGDGLHRKLVQRQGSCR